MIVPFESFANLAAEGRLKGYLTAWAEGCARPIVLFLDEIIASASIRGRW